MSNLEKWLISIELEKVIKDIQKRACPECPAEEYCKKLSAELLHGSPQGVGKRGGGINGYGFRTKGHYAAP
jgi:hypothetical protein